MNPHIKASAAVGVVVLFCVLTWLWPEQVLATVAISGSIGVTLFVLVMLYLYVYENADRKQRIQKMVDAKLKDKKK